MNNLNFFRHFFQVLKTNRKIQIITIIIVASFAMAIILIYYFISNKENKIFGLEKEKNVRHLDGVIVKPEEANLPVIGVIIENLVDVRPQAGLQAAGVVYEALAEGGITRFLALYAGHKADLIGPVRSLRPYYLEWCAEYEAMCTHIGGSPEALQAVSGLGLKDLNAMYESKYFWRDELIPAPHNLFTKSEFLNLALHDKKFDQEPKYEMWKFVDPQKIITEQNSKDEKFIRIDFSGPDYLVEYKFNREKNEYLRFNGNQPHSDKNTNKQISVKNVLIIKLPTKVIDEKGRIEMDVVGERKAYMFSGGQGFEGKAIKKNREGRTYFYHNDGKEHEFIRGNIWIEIIPEDKEVMYN